MHRSPGALLQNPDTRRAAGLATAVMAANVVALGFTVVFAHKLGEARYGSLAALTSTFIILMVPGTALQTTVAREISAAVASGDPAAGAALGRWLRRLAALTVVLSLISVAAREPIAAVIGVRDLPWGAAVALPSGALWLIVQVERGALQAFRRYKLVGASIFTEQCLRLLFAYVLVVAGLGVTGAYLGIPLALLMLAVLLAFPLRREVAGAPHDAHVGRLRELLARAAWPVVALSLIAWLQDGHVIIVKHIASSHAAGAWGAAAVAAKAIMWIAIGLSLYIVPEAARRAKQGLDARGVLGRALIIIGLIAAAMVLVYAAAAQPILHAAFNVSGSAGALPWLGLAMSMLGFAYVGTQYQLALHRVRFIVVLALAAIAEPVVLIAIGPDLTALAFGMLAVLAATTIGVLLLALRPARPPERAAAESERQPAAVLTEA